MGQDANNMFAPPPTPALSKAEIQARRAKSQHAPSISSASSCSDGSAERSSLMSGESTSVEAPSTLIRRIGIFGLGKDEKKTRPAVGISAPFLSKSPTRSPPTVSTARSRPGHPPLLDIAKKLPSPPPPPPPPHSPIARHSHSPSSVVSPIGCPPRRPPRPAADLALDPPSINNREGHVAHNHESLRSAQPQTRRTASDRSISPMALGVSSQAPRNDVQGGEVYKAMSKQRGNGMVVTSINEESNGLRNLIKPPKKSKKLKLAAEHQRTSSLEAALLGLGGTPEQAKRSSPKLSVYTATYSPRGYQHAAVEHDKALPKTPSSIVQTPRELYEASNRSSGAAVTANHGLLEELPEQMPGRKGGRSGMPPTTPTRTQLHLRGGSVVTVTPPELNAWTRTVYLQGPIRLSKPAIVPRKNSLASLEPFQEAVDQVYQDALRRSSRRQSDEAAAKEICEFFIHFGLCDVGALEDEQDKVKVRRVAKDDEDEDDEDSDGDEEEEGEDDDDDDLGFDNEQEMPDSSGVSSVLPRAAMMPVFDLPPVETAETLRARGIARLMKKKQKSSSSMEAKGVARTTNSVLTLVPVPEDSILVNAVRSREESSW